MRQRARRTIVAALGAALVMPLTLPAQIRASELASVSQVVDGTKFSIEYSRPRVRGRDPIWGTKIVYWGEVWTPGANYATTFETNKNVKLNGQLLPKGKYSVWFIVRQAGDWTAVFDTTPRRFHMNRPDTMSARLRLPLKVEEAPFMETLTWSIPAVRNTGATIAMQWEKKRIAIDVEVEPSLRYDMPAQDAQAYIGAYDYKEVGQKDSLKVVTFFVTHENGILKGRWEPEDPYMKKFALIRTAPDMFAPGVYDDKGEIYEVIRPDMVVTFKRSGPKAVSLEVRGETDELWATGKRKN
jgi:hypothetical protein